MTLTMLPASTLHRVRRAILGYLSVTLFVDFTQRLRLALLLYLVPMLESGRHAFAEADLALLATAALDLDDDAHVGASQQGARGNTHEGAPSSADAGRKGAKQALQGAAGLVRLALVRSLAAVHVRG